MFARNKRSKLTLSQVSQNTQNQTPQPMDEEEEDVDEFIPPSQAITSGSEPNTYLDSVLRKCKMTRDDGNYNLEGYVFAFRSQLEEELLKGPNYPHNLQNFLDTLKRRLDNPPTCSELLNCIVIRLPNTDHYPSINQSVVKTLLSIEFLQKEVADMLFTKLRQLAAQDDDYVTFNLTLHQFDDFNHQQDSDYLYEEIFQILPTAKPNARDDLIRSIVYLIETDRQSAAVESVMDAIEAPEQLLTKQNLETFENLYMEVDVLQKLRGKVMDYIKEGAAKSFIPYLVRYLIYTSSKDMEGMEQIFRELRVAINWEAVEPSIAVEIFEILSRAIVRSKTIKDLWFRVISQVTSFTHYIVIDFMILLIIASTYEDYAVMVESLCKRRARGGLFRVSLLESSFKLFGFVVVNNISTSVDLFERLFRDRAANVSRLGSDCFKLVLQIDDEVFDKHAIITKIIAMACMKAVDMPCVDQNLRTNALQLLTDVKEKSMNELRSAFYHLQKILDYGRALTTTQFRLAINILCSLAFEPPGDEVLKDHIEIMIRKQITNSIDSEHRKQAIITLSRMLYYVLWDDGMSDTMSIGDSESTVNSVSQIPMGHGRDMAKMVSLGFKCVESNNQHISLFYDEIAESLLDKQKVATGRPNGGLLKWLSDQMHLTFTGKFVVDANPGKIQGIDVEYQFGINAEEDNQNDEEGVMDIAINISACLTSEYVSTLFAHFNLLRALCLRRYNDLEPVNALLGCALLLPKEFNSPTTFMIVSSKACLDCYLFTINWFREVVGAFAPMPEMRKKVLQRFAKLIELETTLKLIAPTKRGDDKHKKDKRAAEAVPTQAPSQGMDVDATTGNLNLVTQLTGIETQGGTRIARKEKFEISYGPHEKFRQLDIGICKLLDIEFEIKYPVPVDEIGLKLHLEGFRFIIEDLISKMESIPGTKRFKAGQKVQKIANPVLFIEELIEHLPRILECFNQCKTYLNNRLTDADGDEENPELYTDEVGFVKICSGAVVHLLGAFFSWPGFKHEENQNSLLRAYRIFIGAFDDTMDVDDLEVAHQALLTAIGLESIVLDLRAAVHLYHLIKALGELCNEPEEAAKLSKKFLGRKWYALEGPVEAGANTNVLLDELIKGSMKNMSMENIKRELNDFARESMGLKARTDYLETWKNCNRANQHMVFRGLATALLRAVQDITDDLTPTNENIMQWQHCFNLIISLLQVAESVNTHRHWTAFLVQSHKILRIFTRYGKKMVERGLQSHTKETAGLLKTIQKTTRFLHNLCTQSKLTKNSQITNQIPEYRKSIENLIFQIKSAYTKNDFVDDIWTIGQLKNKDLLGEEILTQLSIGTGSNTDEFSEDEAPPEDDDDSSTETSEAPHAEPQTDDPSERSDDDDDEDVYDDLPAVTRVKPARTRPSTSFN